MSEEKKMPGFMTYKEAAIMFTLMPDNEASAVIKASCSYYLYGEETTLSGNAQKVFEIEKAAIDRGRESYAKKRTGGKKGANTRWNKGGNR